MPAMREPVEFLGAAMNENIGFVAGDIFQTLRQNNGRSDMNNLRKALNRVDDMHLHAGIGWLAREGKIQVESSKDGKITISLR